MPVEEASLRHLLQKSLPESLVGRQAGRLGHVLLQELVQVAQAVRIVLHHTDWLVLQAGSHQPSYIGITELGQLLGPAPELLDHKITDPRSQGGHSHQGGTGTRLELRCDKYCVFKLESNISRVHSESQSISPPSISI